MIATPQEIRGWVMGFLFGIILFGLSLYTLVNHHEVTKADRISVAPASSISTTARPVLSSRNN